MSETPSASTTATERTAGTDAEDAPLSTRISNHPRPAIRWVLGLVVLVGIEFGALAGTVLKALKGLVGFVPGDPAGGLLAGGVDATSAIPTLLSRSTIPNQGYWNGSEWVHTFLGMTPAQAWGVRVVAVYLYAFVFLAWLWVGYRTFRNHYRAVEWVPRDDMVDRFRSNRWGQFGLVIVALFLVLAVFAPALGPYTQQGNIVNPYSNQIHYYDEPSHSVKTTTMGDAELEAISNGNSHHVGPLTYDQYDQFHPFGTLTTGKDLFTFVASGSRVSLLIALASIGIAGLIAVVFGMVTAYYKGAVDLAVVVSSDSVQALPFLLIAILALAVLKDTWLGSLYNGAVLLIVLFSLTSWPGLWRAIRGPSFQISESEWIDAARSYGQAPRTIMRKHMLPYVVSYILIYGSLLLGGIILSTAGLTFLGLGISAPTPEWGRAVASGQAYVSTASWHISLIPGLMITLVVIGFNALGDGLRDALDPQSGGDEAAAEGAVAGGGGA